MAKEYKNPGVQIAIKNEYQQTVEIGLARMGYTVVEWVTKSKSSMYLIAKIPDYSKFEINKFESVLRSHIGAVNTDVKVVEIK